MLSKRDTFVEDAGCKMKCDKESILTGNLGDPELRRMPQAAGHAIDYSCRFFVQGLQTQREDCRHQSGNRRGDRRS